jgi:hypothetical protein
MSDVRQRSNLLQLRPALLSPDVRRTLPGRRKPTPPTYGVGTSIEDALLSLVETLAEREARMRAAAA